MKLSYYQDRKNGRVLGKESKQEKVVRKGGNLKIREDDIQNVKMFMKHDF